jgi:predicted AAA+ superfamily ATPase
VVQRRLSTLGRLLETFVFQELRRQASWYEEPLAFFHFRDKDGVEVDLVIEQRNRSLAGVEVKAAATVTAADSPACASSRRQWESASLPAWCCMTVKRARVSAMACTRCRCACCGN